MTILFSTDVHLIPGISALVITTDQNFQPLTPQGRDFFSLAGPEAPQELTTFTPSHAGLAGIGKGFDLAVDFIIRAVVKDEKTPISVNSLRKAAYYICLVAEANRLSHIQLIASDWFQEWFSVEEVAQGMMEMFRKFEPECQFLRSITFSGVSPDVLPVLEKTFSTMKPA